MITFNPAFIFAGQDDRRELYIFIFASTQSPRAVVPCATKHEHLGSANFLTS